MMEYILAVIVLSLLALIIIFWPLKFSQTKVLALLVLLLSLVGLLTLNYFNSKTQQALVIYQQDQFYKNIVVDYLSGKDEALQNSENLEPVPFLRSLQRYLQLNSSDSNAWFVLGNALQGVDNNRHSLMAYQRAYRVNRQDESVAIAYVNARLALLREQQAADFESMDILQDVLQTNPQHETALMLLGAAAYQGKEFALAVDAWERLLAVLQQKGAEQGRELPEKVKSALQASIDKAKAAELEHLNDKTQSTQGSTFAIALTVSIDDDVESELNKLAVTDTAPVLFIYARKPQQKGMPLAAIKQVLNKDSVFPMMLSLTNKNSLAGMDLSGLEQMELSARISFSGQALPQEGDWQSDSLLIKNESFDKPQNLAIYRAFSTPQ